MKHDIDFWKNLSFYALKCIELTFLAHITWDFFSTVFETASYNSEVLLGTTALTSAFVITPWIISIVVLALFLSLYLSEGIYKRRHSMMIFSYSLVIAVYTFLIILAIISPIASLSTIIGYTVTIVWASWITHLRLKIKEALC